MAQELAKSRPSEMVMQSNDIDIGMMMKSLIDTNITTAGVDAMAKLADLYERMQSRKAEAAFSVDFAAMQTAMPSIQAKRMVKRDNGSILYRYASYEDINDQIAPYLRQFGFALSLDFENDAESVEAILTIMHRSGHKIVKRFKVRNAGGPKNCTPAQCDEAAATLAKRCVIAAALNLSTDKSGEPSNDARLQGDGQLITFDQATQLESRLRACGGDVSKFLKFVGVDEFCNIPVSKYTEAESLVARKEQKR